MGVEAGDDDAARRALAEIDWVLRGAARRRLEKALLDAAVATGVTAFDDPEAVRHLLRAAALIVRRRVRTVRSWIVDAGSGASWPPAWC